MRKLRSRLPSPNALVAFEAVARHLSFTKAAQELNVSRGAASSHVKNLEAHVGVLLFERLHRALKLTPAGEALAQTVSGSLEAILKTVGEIQVQQADNRLTVAASPSMATNWLMPRIAEFRAQSTDADIRFYISEDYVDLAQDGIDVGIRYGDGNWAGAETQRLTQVELSPVCSPAYFEGREPLADPSDLVGEHLLHLTGPYEPEMRWSNWFALHGVDVPASLPGLYFDNHQSLVQAALQGQGVALLGWPAVSIQLDGKSLIRPIDIEPTAHKFIWLVWPASRPRTALAQAFCDWVTVKMSR